MRRYREANPAEFARTMKTVEEASDRGHYRRTVARRFARMKGNVTLAWTQEDKGHIGALLLDLMHPMGLFTTETYMRGTSHKVTELHPTEAVLKLIAERSELMSLMSPSYLPTIIPPKPWTGPKNGGYYSPLAHGIRFTITGKGRQAPQEGLRRRQRGPGDRLEGEPQGPRRSVAPLY